MSSFRGRRVVCFESRRAEEMARLIEAHDGVPVVAPSLREKSLEPGPDAIAFGERLREGDLDGVLFLTPGGVGRLVEVMDPIIKGDELLKRLRELPIGARGPKTADALAAAHLPDVVVSDVPHTSRELLDAFDRKHPVAGSALALIEHGVPHEWLRSALVDRGVHVLTVAVYKWVLPEDVGPLTAAIDEIASGAVSIALFTNGAQIDAAMGVASELDLDEPFRDGLRAAVVGAVGPKCAERLRAYGITPSVIPAEHRMEPLVQAAAEAVQELD